MPIAAPLSQLNCTSALLTAVQMAEANRLTVASGISGVRKRLKRLRYLLEFVEPLFPARKVRQMAAALKPAQDALGQYNDELMALHALRMLAADDSNAWFGIGWLSARTQPNAKRCLKEIKTFAAIKPFWRG